MPRTGTLLPLSREHHATLVLARDMQHAARDGTPDERKRRFTQAQTHLREVLIAHFRCEEQLLRMHGNWLPQALIDRLFAEHAQLQDLIAQPPTDLAAGLNAFTELAVVHIRWEERTLFLLLQPLLEGAEVGQRAS